MATTGRTASDDEAARSTAGPAARGVRARLAVHDPPSCAIAETLPDGASAIDARRAEQGDTTVEQFRSSRDLAAEPIFEADGEYVYQLPVDPDPTCPCRLIESLGYPVADVAVTAQRLSVTLLLPSPEPLGDIVDALESTGATVSLECLVRSASADEMDAIVVDRGRLTDRQREVLETAYRMGYFSYPRESNAAAVADALGIVRSTFAEHLAVAQRRLFESVFEDG